MAQADDDAQVGENEPEFGAEPRLAGISLGVLWLVVRRRAPDRWDHPGAEQLLAVSGRHAGRLGGQAAAVEGGEQEVAASVTGEDPAGSVATVSGWGQSGDEDGGMVGAPAGNRPTPVLLVGEGP